ncbi:MAG: glutaredoxin family protein [Actinomycetota bacterium]|nr:glutaredoxin family protein [Actinomycetota bacterium]
MRRLVLFGRPGCHLCDEAREILNGLIVGRQDVEFAEIDIDGDDGLLRAYLERIPVIELDGVVIGELVPDRAALRASLLNTPRDDCAGSREREQAERRPPG